MQRLLKCLDSGGPPLPAPRAIGWIAARPASSATTSRQSFGHDLLTWVNSLSLRRTSCFYVALGGRVGGGVNHALERKPIRGAPLSAVEKNQPPLVRSMLELDRRRWKMEQTA
jgi:hypothetical protein